MPALTPDELGSMPLFACLPEEQRTLLLDRHRETTHQLDQVILMEQDWGESLFVIRDGLAKVRTYTADGDEVIMSLLGQGDVFGEMAVLDGASRSADVVALTPLHLIKMRSAPFASLLGELAPFALALARLEAGRLRDLNQRFALQSADATTRLLDGLAYLARKSSGGQDLQAELPPLAQREIALLAGLARETASRTLSKLRSRGTITEQNGRLRLADLKPLLKRGLIS
tara:strand:- start:308 stop:994 length:687 start_codon:yes stop_codon:yes gene_type:complete